MVIAYVRTWCDNESCHTSVMLAGMHNKAIDSTCVEESDLAVIWKG